MPGPHKVAGDTVAVMFILGVLLCLIVGAGGFDVIAAVIDGFGNASRAIGG